ncbi:conjugative transposon protein TraK [Pedobacter insulae]|uniref:Bacteroides conjugative transposon TraK protein n=1 Tax=Pedobacter insulae TaxID=414048 RepID=A0A1I2ZJH5_9SPHI|nr:conjugative transposon protein TraK [Pedobacter insulae]SFH37958.1 Bacteroides conjugative transposon TraK protein [Pedobacter insulae]
MFRKTKNIDTAFRHIRAFSLVVIITSAIICCYAIYKSFKLVFTMQEKVYVLANGKALEAFASERKDNIPVEARDHIRTFHRLFFNLDPDDKLIKENIGKSLYLADQSAKREYDNLKEKSYYSNIISGNVSQIIRVDSILINVDTHPYLFRCIAKLEIIRSTSIVQRNLVTEGYLRNINRSDNNPHGFLIENWKIIANNDVEIKQRQ